MPHHSRASRCRSRARPAAISVPLAIAFGVPPSPWIDTIADGLPAARADSASICADDLFAPERHHQHGADVGMLAIRGQRVVRQLHVGAELPAACEVRQRHGARHRGRDPLGDHGRADHGRHDEDVIAHAHSPVRPPKSVEAWLRAHRLVPFVRCQIAAAARARDVVNVDVRAGLDVGGRGADRIAVLHHRLTGSDRASARSCGRSQSVRAP